MIKASKWKEYHYVNYLHDIGGIINVGSIISIQVLFFHLLAKSAAKEVIGLQEATLVPAEDENPDEEEQDWD